METSVGLFVFSASAATAATAATVAATRSIATQARGRPGLDLVTRLPLRRCLTTKSIVRFYTVDTFLQDHLTSESTLALALRPLQCSIGSAPHRLARNTSQRVADDIVSFSLVLQHSPGIPTRAPRAAILPTLVGPQVPQIITNRRHKPATCNQLHMFSLVEHVQMHQLWLAPFLF